MYTDDTFESGLSEELLNDSLSDIENAGLPDTRDLRQQRLDSYEAAGLSIPDHREAVLTSASADLLRIGYALADVVKDYLAAEPPTADRVQRITPVLNDYLRVTRQHERYAQLESKLEMVRIQAQEAKSRSQSSAVSRTCNSYPADSTEDLCPMPEHLVAAYTVQRPT